MSEYAARWRSLKDGYLPPDELSIQGGLELHADYDEELDPITYEVLRSRLWSINQDHQETIRRISGSGVTVYAWDFNVSIQTEDGDGVVFGPGILFFAGCADLVVKWTLEHRSGNVGIGPGDVFVQDDPWVGTNHQMDTACYAPIFVDGKLFCWVYNCVHQQEIGGVEPGGFVQQARDTFWEATAFPPLKLVEDGVWREDLVDAWIRRSRLPELCHLELKSQVAGVEFARARMEETIATYGPGAVKGAMRAMIANTESAVRARLRDLPDGRWRDVRWCAGALPGDRDIYRLELAVTKQDERLVFENEGTDPPHGSFNIVPGVWRAAVLNAALPLLAWDQWLCGAGLLRCMEFRPTLGTMMSARHPAAISTSLGTTNAVTQAQYLISKMLGSSPAQRRNMVGASALHTQVYTQMFGIDQNGAPYANFPFDGIAGGSGACSFRDGVDHGGGIISTQLRIGNVEEWERVIPFLYLYRREVPAGGGHGRFRGGTGLVTAWTGYRTEESYVSSGGVVQAATQGNGLSGGYPGSGGTFWSARGTAIRDALASGTWPSTPAELRELAPRGTLPPAKKFDNPLAEGDLFEVLPPLGAGHGDPLLRDAAAVEADIARGRLTAADAERLYGVGADTEQLRSDLRRRRLEALKTRPEAAGRAVADAPSLGFAIETVEIVEADGRPRLACAYCRELLGEPATGYRGGCGLHETRLEDIDPAVFLAPRAQLDVDLVLRHYTCPGCGSFLDSDVCRPDDDVYQDVEVFSA